MSDETIFGVKAATAIAGFFGAIASLSAIKPLSKAQALLAVFTGALTSAYGTPAAVVYLKIESGELQNFIAFVLGLTAMHLVPGLVRAAELFKENPLWVIKRFLGDKKMNALEIIVLTIQVIALVLILAICICRINAMGPRSRRVLKLAYITLAGSAFALLITSKCADHYTAAFALSVAMALTTDKRKSACYGDECPLP